VHGVGSAKISRASHFLSGKQLGNDAPFTNLVSVGRLMAMTHMVLVFS